MNRSALAEIDAQYRLLREACGYVQRPGDGFIEASGPDAAEYLQGQVTNDVEALAVGEGAYSALLERKARIQADMDVLRLDEGRFLIHTAAGAHSATFKHLDMYRIGRDVEITDRSGELRALTVAGPAGPEAVIRPPRGELEHERSTMGGVECRVVTRPIGDLPAFNLIFEAGCEEPLAAALASAGAEEVGAEALEIARVEAGIPRFGSEITGERMPAEAGIVERAVSFTKGCYIGQEPVARLHHRGRPNRHLGYLELSAPAAAGSELTLEGKSVGELTSSVLSPARGAIGLAILRREAEPGAVLEVAGGEATATVRDRPAADGWSA